jgi:hypothetical protein
MTVLNIYIYIYIYICRFDNTAGVSHLNIKLNIADFRKIPKLFCGFTYVSEMKLLLQCCTVNKPLDQSL